VEFALVVPVFLLLLFGAIEFGRAFFVLHLMANAAREGAREASLPDKTVGDVESAVDGFIIGVGLDTNLRTTTIGVIPAGSTEPDGTPLSEAISGDRVRVDVSYDFQIITGSFVPGLSDPIALAGRCTYRHE
jgi:hypothetical protein